MSPYLPGAALITESMITKLNQDIQVSLQAMELLSSLYRHYKTQSFFQKVRKILLSIGCLFMGGRFLVCQLWFLCRLDIFWLIFQHSLHMLQYGHRVLRPHTSPCPYRLCTVYQSHHFHFLLDQGNLLRGIVNWSSAA